jgi:hypothetical protein
MNIALNANLQPINRLAAFKVLSSAPIPLTTLYKSEVFAPLSTNQQIVGSGPQVFTAPSPSVQYVNLTPYIWLQSSGDGSMVLGPLNVFYNDGSATKQLTVGFNFANVLHGEGKVTPMTETRAGLIGSTMGGKLNFVIAPNTSITFSMPFTFSSPPVPVFGMSLVLDGE